MPPSDWLRSNTPAFRLMIATSWLAPETWRDKQRQAIWEAIEAGPNWDEYLRLVARHRTPALSWAALKRVSEFNIPEASKRSLQKLSDACRIQALRHVQLLTAILKAFNCAEIPVMPLKGPLLSLELYGDFGLRQSKDLDLAIAQQDIPMARACLEKLGWTLDPNGFHPTSDRQWDIYWRNEGQLVFFHSLGDCTLELQWRNYREDETETRNRWAKSISSVWHGCSYRAMNTVNQVLYLCGHGGEHAWFRAKWMGDLARIHATQAVDWEAARQEAVRSNHERELLAALWLLKEVYGLPLPELAGNPWKALPEFVIKEELRCLKDPEEFGDRGALAQFRDQLRKFHHDRLLRPHTTWLQNVAAFTYRSADFKEFPLPDGFFWTYAPLRPFLWAGRKLRRDKAARKESFR